MDNTDIITLLPKQRKGILRLIFSRIGLFVLLLLIEVGILFSVYLWFADYFKWFTVGQAVFSIGMLFYLFNCCMDATAKLTWLYMIMLFPVPATIMLFFTRKNIGHRTVKALVEHTIEQSKDKLTQDKDILERDELVESGTAAYALAKTHYKSLVKSGVKIYEYTPGFVHAKVFVSDDVKAVVGTINLDYRSLYHHFECATYMYKTGCIEDIERDFQAMLEGCREVTLETIRREKYIIRFWAAL